MFADSHIFEASCCLFMPFSSPTNAARSRMGGNVFFCRCFRNGFPNEKQARCIQNIPAPCARPAMGNTLSILTHIICVFNCPPREFAIKFVRMRQTEKNPLLLPLAIPFLPRSGGSENRGFEYARCQRRGKTLRAVSVEARKNSGRKSFRKIASRYRGVLLICAGFSID